jgi:hypothetical protein
MPYHVVVYSANTNTQTNYDSVPATDPLISIQNGHYFPHIVLYMYGGWLGGVNLTAVTLVTPRSRMIVPPRLTPIQAAVIPPDRPHIFDRRNNPFTLNAVEEVSIQMTIGGTANAYNFAVLFWGTSLDPVPQGDLYTLHGTSSTTVTANAWTQIPITWDQTIPAGTYTVISSQHQSSNALCHRFFFKDQILRPGFLSLSSVTNISDPTYYYGAWGTLGTFNTTAYPTIEAFCNGADSSHDLMTTIVRTG